MPKTCIIIEVKLILVKDKITVFHFPKHFGAIMFELLWQFVKIFQTIENGTAFSISKRTGGKLNRTSLVL
jgi:hypothetical protein